MVAVVPHYILLSYIPYLTRAWRPAYRPLHHRSWLALTWYISVMVFLVTIFFLGVVNIAVAESPGTLATSGVTTPEWWHTVFKRFMFACLLAYVITDAQKVPYECRLVMLTTRYLCALRPFMTSHTTCAQNAPPGRGYMPTTYLLCTHRVLTMYLLCI